MSFLNSPNFHILLKDVARCGNRSQSTRLAHLPTRPRRMQGGGACGDCVSEPKHRVDRAGSRLCGAMASLHTLAHARVCASGTQTYSRKYSLTTASGAAHASMRLRHGVATGAWKQGPHPPPSPATQEYLRVCFRAPEYSHCATMVSSFSTVRGPRSVQERAAALAGTLVAGQFRAMDGLQPEDLNTDGTARVSEDRRVPPLGGTSGYAARVRT